MCTWEGLQCRRDPTANRRRRRFARDANPLSLFLSFVCKRVRLKARAEITPAGVTKTSWGNVPASLDLLGHTRLAASYDTRKRCWERT